MDSLNVRARSAGQQPAGLTVCLPACLLTDRYQPAIDTRNSHMTTPKDDNPSKNLCFN